jgi:hypothetical protein
MATAVEIGALTFRFLGDTKSIDQAHKKINTDMGALDSRVARTAASVKKSVAVMTAAFIGIGGALAASIKKSATEMDSLLKASQRLGIPIEQLSALKYAADLSGSSLEGLSASLRVLNRNLGDVAAGATGDATNAFQAIGVSVSASNGQLRSTTDILLDVADKFATFEDGANKSALAMALFGRQGAELIPLLNSGRSGINQMTGEAKRFGVVVNADAARAAEQFNDNIDRLTTRMSGWSMAIANEVLPILNKFADRVDYAASLGDKFYLAFLGDDERTKAIAASVANITTQVEGLARALERSNSQLVGISNMAANLTWGSAPKGQAPDITGQREAAAEELRAQSAIMSSWHTQLGDTLSDGSIGAAEKMDHLVAALQRGTIGFYDFGQAVKSVNDENRDNITGLATDTANALTSIFQENKAAAIAAAIINTAVGITEAMKLPPPFDFAKAALVAATGAAQVMAIRSTSKSGGGSAPSVSGGGSSSSTLSSTTSGGGADGGGGVRNSLHVSGIGATDLFTGEMVRGLSEQIIKYQRDGGKVILDGVL